MLLLKSILKIILIIFISAIPLLILTSDILCYIFSIKKEDSVEIAKAILPLIFSIIILLINSILTEIKDKIEIRKNKLIKYNKRIKIYNMLFLNSKKMYHTKMRYLRQAIHIETFFFEIPELKTIYSKWKKSLKDNLDGSNKDEIRKELREVLLSIINILFQSHKNLNFIELLGNSKIYLSNINLINDEQEVFMSQFASDKLNDSKEKTIVHFLSEILSNDGNAYHTLEKYNNAVDELKNILSIEATQKIYYDKTYGVVIELLNLIENLILDLTTIEYGLNIFSKKYQEIYEIKKKEFPEIDTAFFISEINIPSDVINYFDENAYLKKLGLIN